MTSTPPADWSAQVDWRSGSLRARTQTARTPSVWHPPPQPGTLPKRPLTFFEALDGGFRLLRFAPGATFGVSLLVQTIASLLIALAIAAAAVGSTGFLMRTLTSSPEAGLGVNMLMQTVATAGSLAALSLLHLLSGFSAVAGDAAFDSDRVTLREVWSRLLGVRWRLVGLTALSMAVHVGALVVLVAPGLLMLLAWPVAGVLTGSAGFLLWLPLTAVGFSRFALAGSVLAVERTGAVAALRRSWALTRGTFWRTLGQLVLAYFLSTQIISLIMSPLLTILLVAAAAVAIVMTLGGGASIALLVALLTVLGVAVLALTMAMGALFFAYLCGTASCVYFDRRMRTEGYDLLLLRRAEHADRSREVPNPGSAAAVQQPAVPGSAQPGNSAAPSDGVGA